MKPLKGFLLLLLALFVGQAHQCGLLGQALARGLTYLLGAYGTSLVVVALVAGGITVSGAAEMMWLFVRGIVKRERVVVRSTRKQPTPIAVEVTVAPKKQMPTVERMKITDLRTALKNLGYESGEYAPVIAHADPALPLETLVRGALKELRRN